MDTSQVSSTEVSMQAAGEDNMAFTKDATEYDVNMNTSSQTPTGANGTTRRRMSVEEMMRRPSFAVSQKEA